MKKIDSFWKLSDWFTKEVNKLTIFHNINELQTRKFLYTFAEFYNFYRNLPPENGSKRPSLFYSNVEAKYILELTFQKLNEDNVSISSDIKSAIDVVIRKKMFFFYPLNYKRIDRLINLCEK